LGSPLSLEAEPGSNEGGIDADKGEWKPEN